MNINIKTMKHMKKFTLQLFMWRIHAPCDESRLSHLVHPKGETCKCTMVPLNPLPLLAFLSPPIHPFHPMQSVVEAVQTAQRPPPPPHGNTKAAIYQYVLVTFRGQCCCSWMLPAGSQEYSSVSVGHYMWVWRNVRCCMCGSGSGACLPEKSLSETWSDGVTREKNSVSPQHCVL